MIGHGLGAAGGLEAIASIKAITTGWLHPTINQYVRYCKLSLFSYSPLITFDWVSNLLLVHIFIFKFIQNLEPAVTIDTVPNVKKKHEVNVGMSSN